MRNAHQYNTDLLKAAGTRGCAAASLANIMSKIDENGVLVLPGAPGMQPKSPKPSGSSGKTKKIEKKDDGGGAIKDLVSKLKKKSSSSKKSKRREHKEK